MPNFMVIFPSDKKASADAYLAAADAHWAANYEPGGKFSEVRPDYLGRWAVGYYGPPFFFLTPGDVPEPEGFEALRADGEIHETVTWPPEE